MRYIVVEGVIGVGKTTLTRSLALDYKAKDFYEIVEDNPFLSDFYKNKTKYAFDTEIYFLLSRFRQQRELEHYRKTSQDMVLSDYLFDKNKIFAQITLNSDDFRTFSLVFYGIHSKIISPDLVVYLRNTPENLMERIAHRDRPFERNMDYKYIATLCRQYDAFFETYKAGNLLVMDVSKRDFVANRNDYLAIKNQIEEKCDWSPHNSYPKEVQV